MLDNLITSLYGKLVENPHSMSAVDWIDVEVYCTSWVHGREEIYPDEEYSAFINKVHNLCRTIKAEVESKDYSSAMLLLAELSGIIEAMPEIDYYRSAFQKGNFDAMMHEHYKRGTSVILGDSHVNFFSGHEQLSYTPIGYGMYWCKTINELPITALHIGSGLAYNTCKYGTTSRFRERTEFMLDNHIKPGSHLLVTLGEVDCRAHVLKQADLQKRDYHEIVDDITNNYIEFLKYIKNRGFIVGCWGPVASQSDDVKISPEDNYPRYGSEVQRNKVTEYFNRRMESLCKAEDILFLSLFDRLIDSGYKTKTAYYAEDGVHLSQAILPAAEELLRLNSYI